MKKTWIIYTLLLAMLALKVQGQQPFTETLPSSFLSGKEEKRGFKTGERQAKAYTPVFSGKGQDIFSQDEEPSLSAPPPGASEDDAIKIQAPMNAKEYAVFLLLAGSMVLVYGKRGRKMKG
ncbi:MAG: hypothetical protein LUG18_15075 [Candidatus Azobacteroides sp.]|nr:hypothetical protein [Candidatus Azobacteroides sp.]